MVWFSFGYHNWWDGSLNPSVGDLWSVWRNWPGCWATIIYCFVETLTEGEQEQTRGKVCSCQAWLWLCHNCSLLLPHQKMRAQHDLGPLNVVMVAKASRDWTLLSGFFRPLIWTVDSEDKSHDVHHPRGQEGEQCLEAIIILSRKLWRCGGLSSCERWWDTNLSYLDEEITEWSRQKPVSYITMIASWPLDTSWYSPSIDKCPLIVQTSPANQLCSGLEIYYYSIGELPSVVTLFCCLWWEPVKTERWQRMAPPNHQYPATHETIMRGWDHQHRRLTIMGRQSLNQHMLL